MTTQMVAVILAAPPNCRMSTASRNNIAYTAHADLGLIILCHGRQHPTNAEWAPYVQLLSDTFTKDVDARVLVITEGGHPSREQQAEMNAALRSASARVAVISPSVVARFVTSILVMTNPGIRCFSPEQRHEAYAHLGFSASRASQIDKMAAQVSRALALPTNVQVC